MSWLAALIGAPVDTTPPPATDRHPELDRMPQPDYSGPLITCPLCSIPGHGATVCQMAPCLRLADDVEPDGCRVCTFPADWHDIEEDVA